MIEPYQVVGLIPTMRGIRYRDEIKRNIEHLNELMTAASWLSSMALPVRLITIPEGALQGFNDEVLDHDHEWFAEHCAIDIPGPETDALGEMAAKWNAYVMATAKVRHANFPGRFFNAGFAISPANEIVLTHYKVAPLQPVEHSLTAELSTGERIPADIIVRGTGFRQSVPFLDKDIQDRTTDERGNFQLYRQIKPLDVPHLSFSGYNSYFFSPLSAEVAGLWIACRLLVGLPLPAVEQQRAHVEKRLRWMEERTAGHHARGTNIIPFSMHNVDEMLSDLDLNVDPLTRATQWLLPVNPHSYRKLTGKLLNRQGQ